MRSEMATRLDPEPATSGDRATPKIASPANAELNEAPASDAQPSREIDGADAGPRGESGRASTAEVLEQATPDLAATAKPAKGAPQARPIDEVNQPSLRPDRACEAQDRSAIAGYVADRLQRMKRGGMDHRKLAGLVKAAIDQTNLNDDLSRPFTIGARDRLAEGAAARLLRRGLATNDIPRALAEATMRLPAVAKRLAAQFDEASNHRRDRIDAKQIRAGRKAGLLSGLDPWG